MYENIRKSDKVPDEKSDIYVDMTGILQRMPGYDSQFEMSADHWRRGGDVR